MTVSAALELRDKRKFGFAKGGVRTYRRTFLVVTDTKTDGPQAILGASGIPQHLSAYSLTSETDFAALAVSFSARQLPKTPLHWHVTVSYTTDVDKDKEEQQGGTSEGDGDILLEPPTVAFGFETYRIVAHEDVGGEDPIALVNSAGQPFDPPLMIDDSRPVLTVARNEFAFDPLQAIDFKDAINNDKFIGAEIGQVKVKGITATTELQPGNPESEFWRVTYIFLFRREGWKLRVLDTGTRVKTGGPGGEFKPYTEDGVVTEVELDGFGNKLTDGANPVFLEFDVYKTRTFAQLQIDQTLGIPGFTP